MKERKINWITDINNKLKKHDLILNIIFFFSYKRNRFWGLTAEVSGQQLQLIQKMLEIIFQLGLLYSAFTYYTGFKVNSGEYKLTPDGNPIYKD